MPGRNPVVLRGSIEVAADERNLCGEAPLWDHREQCLFWVDQDNPGLFRYVPTENKVYTLGRSVQISGIALNRRGGFVAGGRNGLFTWDEGRTCRIIQDTHEGAPLVFNDLIAGPGGRIYGGTLYWDESGMVKEGALYRVEPDGTVEVEDEGIILSNGLAFSPDNRTLYYTDSGERTIFQYSCNEPTGRLANRRICTEIPSEEGIPDGITVDAEGFVWCALWYGGKVARFDPDGVKEREIQLPVKQVSSVMFGGADLCDLYVTSAGQYWPSSLEPEQFDTGVHMGGALYRIRLDIPGKPELLAGF